MAKTKKPAKKFKTFTFFIIGMEGKVSGDLETIAKEKKGKIVPFYTDMEQGNSMIYLEELKHLQELGKQAIGTVYKKLTPKQHRLSKKVKLVSIVRKGDGTVIST